MTINAWIAYVVGGLYVLLLGALAVVLIVNADLRATIATDVAATSLLEAQNKEWAQKITASNAAFEKIKAADAANAKAAAKAEALAEVSEKKLANEAALIAGLKFSGSDCEQASALGKFYLENK